MSQAISRVASNLTALNQRLIDFATRSAYAQRATDPDVCDFVFGNPHEMPLQGITDALRRWSVPQNKDWFAYKMYEPSAQAAVAESLRRRYGIPFEDQDIQLTTGAFSAIAVTLRAILDPGDEVIMNTPPWFFYDTIIVATGGVTVRVPVRQDNFDLDLAAIEAAITPRTRAVLVNSPNNPTGRIYPLETLSALADLLTRSSARIGRPIYLMSDEAYSRIIFDGREFHTPVAHYPNAFLIYTYGKTLLAPGQRLGYVALPPTMSERDTVREALFISTFAVGYAFPNAIMQYSLPELEQMSIDIGQLQRRRDRLVEALRGMGYQVHMPEGTFYLLPRSPWPDDIAFCDLLAEQNVFCLPGSLTEVPGYFRISLTANDAMVERAIPRFQSALERARAIQPTTG